MVESYKRYATIDSDEWEDAGKIYTILDYDHRNPESTAVLLTLKHEDGPVTRRVVPYHWINWVENGE